MASSTARSFPRIKAIRSFVVDGVGSGGDYHNVKGGHWLIDTSISTPMSRWEKYRASRTSWGINVLGSFCVEVEATDGTMGFATGFGGLGLEYRMLKYNTDSTYRPSSLLARSSTFRTLSHRR
jgi:L-rhamnonate dehydratase